MKGKSTVLEPQENIDSSNSRTSPRQKKTEKDFGDAEGDVVGYIRVSSAKQRDDFERKRT